MRRQFMKVFVVISFLIFSIIIVFGINLQRQQKLESITKYDMPISDENALDILTKTVRNYDELSFYKSSGITDHIELNNGKNKIFPQTHFDLTYQFPETFNLSWKDAETSILRCLKIDSNYSVLEIDGKISKNYDRTNDAVFDVSSENGKSRFYILSLLAFNKNFISPLKNLQRLDDEVIDDEVYYKISADVRGVATKAEVNFTYWIEKKTFLIKKIQREIAFEGIKTVTTENYLNIEIK
jgi:hypothetical protein